MKIAIPAAALLLAAVLAPALAAEESDLRDGLSSEVPAERIQAIEGLADAGADRASRLIGRRLYDTDPSVRRAAAAALGRIGDRSAIRALLASERRLKDDPQTLAAVATALGETGSPAAVDTLAGIAKREMSRNADLTAAAVAALGRIRSRDAVDELIGLLGSATPSYTNRTYSYGHPELMRPISNALTALTGQRLREHAAWAEWWRHEKRGYRFPEDPAEMLKKKVYEDTGFRYSIERPDRERWKFVRDRVGALVVRYAGPIQDSTYAEIWISVYNVSGHSLTTPEALAEHYSRELQDTFRDMRESTLDGHDRLGHGKAVFQHVVGMTKKGSILRVCQWIAREDDFLYTVRATVSTGSSEKVLDDVDAIVDSFRFLRR